MHKPCQPLPKRVPSRLLTSEVQVTSRTSPHALVIGSARRSNLRATGRGSPPEGGFSAESGTPARNSRRSYSQNRACALTGFSRFPPDAAWGFSPRRKAKANVPAQADMVRPAAEFILPRKERHPTEYPYLFFLQEPQLGKPLARCPRAGSEKIGDVEMNGDLEMPARGSIPGLREKTPAA